VDGADGVDIFHAAKKKAVDTFVGFIPEKRNLPTGIFKAPSGKFVSGIQWKGKRRYIGTFDTPEQASAVRMYVKKDLDEVKSSSCEGDEVKATFDAAKKKSLETARAMKESDKYGDEYLV
jgi:hypothetical protein